MMCLLSKIKERSKYNKLKECSKCKNKYPETIEYFYTNKSNKDGKMRLNSWCKICQKENSKKNKDLEKQRQWYHDNKKYWKEYNFEYYQNDDKLNMKQERERNWRIQHPEKIKVYGELHRDHDISTNEWSNCLRVFNHLCSYCGMSEKESLKINRQRLHKDHVVHDGHNDLRNAIPACRSCNSSKKQYDIKEWFAQQAFYCEDKLIKINEWITEGYKEHIETKPPYRILRKQNKGSRTYQFQLWTVDEHRNIIECIKISSKKKDVQKYADIVFA